MRKFSLGYYSCEKNYYENLQYIIVLLYIDIMSSLRCIVEPIQCLYCSTIICFSLKHVPKGHDSFALQSTSLLIAYKARLIAKMSINLKEACSES